MSFNFVDLDDRTRQLMVEELDTDAGSGTVYPSPRLTETGLNEFPALLRDAFTAGDETTLAVAIRVPGRLKTHEKSHTKTGREIVKQVPEIAADTLAEGEFNRFYVRALCRRAIEEQRSLVVYRAKQGTKPRDESEAMIGKTISSERLLSDLRTHPGVEPALGLPPGPNSGLSVCLA